MAWEYKAMRLMACAIALGLATAGAAAGQSYASKSTLSALNDAAFAPKTAAAPVEREGYRLGAGPLAYRSGEVTLSSSAGGPVDSVRINVAGVLRTPGGLPLSFDRSRFEARDVDVTLVRKWPKAVSFASDSLAVDIEPHAGFGVSRFGGSAEGGAVLTVSGTPRSDRAAQRLKELGIEDGAEYGKAGRWYFFAAADGRAVGLNMLHGADGGWDRGGWTTDFTGALVGDAQIGVGWRKGDVQSSFGVIHREVKGQHMIFGQTTRDDTVAAFTFSFRPGR